MVQQDLSVPNPVANGGGYTADGESLLLVLFLLIFVLWVFERCATDRRPRRRPWRSVDPTRIAPLTPSATRQRPRRFRQMLAFDVICLSVVATAVVMAPLSKAIVDALSPAFSLEAPRHGIEAGFALNVLVVYACLFLVTLLAPQLSWRRRGDRDGRRTAAGPPLTRR